MGVFFIITNMLKLNINPIDLQIVLDKCVIDSRYAKHYYNVIRELNNHDSFDSRFQRRVQDLSRDFGDIIYTEYEVEDDLSNGLAVISDI